MNGMDANLLQINSGNSENVGACILLPKQVFVGCLELGQLRQLFTFWGREAGFTWQEKGAPRVAGLWNRAGRIPGMSILGEVWNSLLWVPMPA